LDTHENDNHYIVSADLPGIRKEDIKVSVKDGLLTMEAERKHETDIGDEDSHYVERVYGHVQRSVKLPRTADESQIKCTFQNGVLNVSIAKRDPSSGNGGYLQIE
jgi:HSP20 family protein